MQKDMKITIDDLFAVGAHYGCNTSKRHPSVSKYIYGKKNNTAIIDLEKALPLIEKALEFVATIASEGKQILFIGSKREVARYIREGADKIDMPYVAERWVGGTLTNFPEIRRRVDRLIKLTDEREKGLLSKYTKKERLLIDREIARLEKKFAGIISLDKKPGAVFVVDSKHEHIAVKEAKDLKVPVIAICNTDTDIKKVDFPILANDSSAKSVELIIKAVISTYSNSKK